MNKFVISSGHGKIVRGAKGFIDEHDEAVKVVNKVAEYLKQLGATIYTFHDNTSKTQNENLNTIVNYHNSKVRELDISVHFNANTTTQSPMGTEVCYYNQKEMSATMSKVISTALGTKDRGAKERKELYFLRNTDKPAYLIEVCFVDSKADVDLYNKNFDKMCRAIAETLAGKKLPVVAKRETHTVVKGDTLYGIAKECKTTVNELIKLNPLVDVDTLKVGTKLIVK